MSKKYDLINIKYIINKFRRDTGFEDINEDTLLEWAVDAIEQLSVNTLFHNKVALLKVENYKTSLPEDFNYEVSLHKLKEDEVEDLCEKSIEQTNEVIEKNEEDLNEFFQLDCRGNPILEEYEKQYQPYLKLWIVVNKEEVSKKAKNSNRLEKVNVFNYKLKDYSNREGYRIENRNILTTFDKGNILLLYKAYPTDEEGYPLLVNDVSFLTAVERYIEMMYLRRLWLLGRQGFGEKYQKVEQDWHWYAQQTKNKFYMPYTEDDYLNVERYIHSHLKKYRK